jgi:hypothetical protein
LKLFTIQKIQDYLEESFNNNVDFKLVKITVKEKGIKRTIIKDAILADLRKTYLLPCQLIINEILSIQQRKHHFDHYINLSKKQLEQYLTSRTRLTALFILEHTLGIIEVNHTYRFNSIGNLQNRSKAYIISTQYIGDLTTVDVRDITRRTNYENRHHTNRTNNKGTPQGQTEDNTGSTTHTCIGVPIVCETTGRIYNHVNMMKKEDRALLTDSNGRKLVDVDFSSSHLQMLVKAIGDDLKGGNYEPKFGANGKDYLIQEVLQFKHDVFNNDFYTTMASEYSIMNKTNYTRDLAKLNVMYWLTGCFTSRKFIQFLRKKYEQITHYIEHVNKNESTGYKTIIKKNFTMSMKKKNGMAVRLMRIESTLVNDIHKTLTEKHPLITLYTIFDGFLVDHEHKDMLIKMIEQKGREYLGFEPKLKVYSNCHEDVKETIQKVTDLIDDNGVDITTMPKIVDESILLDC